jgi:hypothetical protein
MAASAFVSLIVWHEAIAVVVVAAAAAAAKVMIVYMA